MSDDPLVSAWLDGGEAASAAVPAAIREGVAHVAAGDLALVPPACFTLGQLRRRPELLRPPATVVERIAYRGCLTMVSAAEKVGKSTLLGQAAAAASTGTHFLGELCEPVPVLWLALDEPLPFLVRRLNQYQADDGLRVVVEHGITLSAIRELAVATGTRMVVVDTLSEYIVGTVDDSNSADQLTPVLRGFRQLAQAADLAVVILHHTGRNGVRYRGSGAIGAGVDLILEMGEVEGDPRLRRVKVRGRIGIESFAIRYDGTQYHLDDAGRERTVAERIVDYCLAHPGTSLRQIQREVGGKAEAVAAAVQLLLDTNQIEDTGGDRGRKLRVAGITGNHSGSTTGSTEGIRGNQQGSTGNHSGSTREAPVIPGPKGVLGKHSPAGRSGITANNDQEAA